MTFKIAYAFGCGRPLPPIRYGGERSFYYLSIELPKFADTTIYCDHLWYPHWKQWSVAQHDYLNFIPINEYDAILNQSGVKFACSHVVNMDLGYGGLEKNVVVCSQKEANRTDLGWKTKPRIVHWGTDVDVYKYQPNKEDYFVYFARIHESKGVQVAVEVARRSGIKLKVMGEDRESPFFDAPNDHEFVEKMKRECAALPNVEYIGSASNETVIDTLGHAKASIYPIRAPFQFDLTVIETLSCGTPVIVSDIPAPCELIEDGKTGFICPHDDIDSFCRATQRVSDLKPEVIRQVAVEKWSSRRMAREFFELCQEVARGGSW